MTPGKVWGLRRMADASGHFSMLAIDQRPPIAELIAARRGIGAAGVACGDMLAVKRALAETLASEVSAVLVDPNFAYPAAVDALSPRAGLIVTLEHHVFEDGAGGRRSRSIRDWSVAKIKRLGADAVKLLAWYRPDAEAEVKRHQQAYVESVGRACAEHDIAFVLELLVYPFARRASDGSEYREDPAKRPELVLESVREFAAERYAVDLFKLESPLPAAAISGAPDSAQRWFDAIGALLNRPWAMLSGGAAPDVFAQVLQCAYRAGASGYLAGRAIWWEALQAYPDLDLCRRALRAQGRRVIAELNALTARHARAWVPAAQPLPESEGEFAAGYAAAGR